LGRDVSEKNHGVCAREMAFLAVLHKTMGTKMAAAWLICGVSWAGNARNPMVAEWRVV
jgi:hypothetical protein